MSTMTARAGDVDEFARLKADEDPRTIEEMIADEEYEDFTIEKAEPYSDDSGYWTIQWNNGTGTGVKPPEGVKIKVGDTIRFYGRGAGHVGGRSNGWALNGQLMEWKTPWERFADRVQWLANYDREKRERFAKERDEMDARYEALSDPLKARIDSFRAESADFRIDSESYEMYACVDADLIANLLRPRVEAGEDPDALVDEFKDLPWEKQVEAGVQEGHSGNTFGGACALARRLLKGGAGLMPSSPLRQSVPLACARCGQALLVKDGPTLRCPACGKAEREQA
jgi:hypothetical protein